VGELTADERLETRERRGPLDVGDRVTVGEEESRTTAGAMRLEGGVHVGPLSAAPERGGHP
jgi:hypothetical protein